MSGESVPAEDGFSRQADRDGGKSRARCGVDLPKQLAVPIQRVQRAAASLDCFASFAISTCSFESLTLECVS
jgi:hypothetical protein